MKLARVELHDGGIALAVVEEQRVRIIADYTLPTLLEVLEHGPPGLAGESLPIDAVTFLSPVDHPPSVRDFMVFEEHVANARQRAGRDVPDAWYEAPAFYFSNPASLVGHDAAVRAPRATRALDFELEVACVIGREACDLDADDPRCLDAIAGFALFNDWSARDIQVNEMKVGLGPVKGKDFCSSMGPWIVTPDELTPAPAGRWSCQIDAHVNGRRVGGGDIVTAHFGWNEIIARASENTCLVPGDVIGSGTIGTGCLLELRETAEKAANPWLAAGDVVELRGGPLGVLRNHVTGEAPPEPAAVTRHRSIDRGVMESA
jgi:fumarylacetoacetate (FAA) hydrolase